MTKNYLLQHGTRATPQSEPMREDQVENSAGGYSWGIDEWTQLRRFLILGSEGGSYYASERDLTFTNIQSIRQCLKIDGPRTINEIVSISEGGRAPKNDPALYALAVAISLGDKETKRLAAEALPRVARIGTHLYHFVAYAETMRGWGRTMRWAVSNWYAQNPQQLALQAIKYRQRDGWSHRDLLRLAHPGSADSSSVRLDADTAVLFNWITGHHTSEQDNDLDGLVHAFEAAQLAKNPKETANLVREYRLPREALNPDHLVDKDVWAALLETGMPMHAMTRNLANMTRVGVLDSIEHRTLVLQAFSNPDAIHKSRLHPLALLIALKTYAQGHGFRGGNTWNPLPSITDALDAAFYLAFDNVESTGKSHLLALDVSSSMTYGNVAGSPLSPCEASAAMALVTLHAEDNVEVMGFATSFIPLNLSRRQRLDDAVRAISRISFGGTDCSLPMLWASENSKSFDAFVTLTDSETWFGNIHPSQALIQYRNSSAIHDAKMVVMGMVSNGFSIADPNDQGSMDVVGFDTHAPALIADFVGGRI